MIYADSKYRISCGEKNFFLMENYWVQFILLLAPFVVVPLALAKNQDFHISSSVKIFSLFSAVLLLIAHWLAPGWMAGFLACAWLFTTLFYLWEFYHFWKDQEQKRSLVQICQLIAFLYLCVGAMWAVADRMAWQPMGFDPLIVLLTAVHFHYAGFALVWITSKLLPQVENVTWQYLAGSVVLGVPLTAIGITTSQFDWSPLIEVLAVLVMAVGGLTVGGLHLRLAIVSKSSLGIRSLWTIAGLSLIAGMSLAFLYGIRYYYPISFLSIPWMYAVHGSLNSLGFALPALIAWYWYLPSYPSTVNRQ